MSNTDRPRGLSFTMNVILTKASKYPRKLKDGDVTAFFGHPAIVKVFEPGLKTYGLILPDVQLFRHYSGWTLKNAMGKYKCLPFDISVRRYVFKGKPDTEMLAALELFKNITSILP